MFVPQPRGREGRAEGRFRVAAAERPSHSCPPWPRAALPVPRQGGEQSRGAQGPGVSGPSRSQSFFFFFLFNKLLVLYHLLGPGSQIT